MSVDFTIKDKEWDKTIVYPYGANGYVYEEFIHGYTKNNPGGCGSNVRIGVFNTVREFSFIPEKDCPFPIDERRQEFIDMFLAFLRKNEDAVRKVRDEFMEAQDGIFRLITKEDFPHGSDS